MLAWCDDHESLLLRPVVILSTLPGLAAGPLNKQQDKREQAPAHSGPEM